MQTWGKQCSIGYIMHNFESEYVISFSEQESQHPHISVNHPREREGIRHGIIPDICQ